MKRCATAILHRPIPDLVVMLVVLIGVNPLPQADSHVTFAAAPSLANLDMLSNQSSRLQTTLQFWGQNGSVASLVTFHISGFVRP